MYIECKGGGSVDLPYSNYGVETSAAGLTGPARIGLVTFSKTGATLYYKSRSFQSLKGGGFKSNYYDIEAVNTIGSPALAKTARILSMQPTSPRRSTRMCAASIGPRYASFQVQSINPTRSPS